MKTLIIIAAMLVVMPSGCRAPRSLGSAGEPGGHGLATRETPVQPDSRSLVAAPAGMERPAAQSNLPVSELLARAEQSIHAEQFVVARSHLQSVLAQQPDHSRAHHLLAVISDLDGRYLDAEVHYFAALAQDPYNASIVGDLGYSYYLQSKFQESEQYLHRALELDPQHGGAAKNLAQLYADHGEMERAEQVLRSTIPETEADLALRGLRPQPAPRDTPSLLSNLIPGRNHEPTAELTERAREQRDAASRAEIAARAHRRRELENQETNLAQTGAADPPRTHPPAETAGINPWSPQLSRIDASGAPAPSPAPGIGPDAPRSAHQGAAVSVNPQSPGTRTPGVGGQTPAEEFPVIQPVAGAGPGAVRAAVAATSVPPTASDPAERRWPPAAWAPLTETQPQAGAPEPYSRNAPADIQQLSGSVNPWNVDVRHAVGRGGRPDVQRAHFEDPPGPAAGDQSIVPVTAHGPNTPAVVPQGRTPAYESSAATARAIPGGSDRNGGQYPTEDRALSGDSGNRPSSAATAPTPYDPYQSVRQSYNEPPNNRGDSTYAQSPAGGTPTPASRGTSPACEVPAYPHGPAAAAAPPVTPQTGTPWPSRAAAPAPLPTESPAYPVVAPAAQRSAQSPVSPTAGTYERYPGTRGY